MEPDDAPVPKLPHGGKFKLSSAQLMRIAITASLLVIIIIARKPCSDSMGKFVTGFGSGSAGSNAMMPKPGNVDLPNPDRGTVDTDEVLGSNMTQAEFDAIRARAEAKARAHRDGAGSGSNAR